MVLGFQLFCVLVNAFSPSAGFEPFVKDFLARHIEQNINGIGIMALCKSSQLTLPGWRLISRNQKTEG